MYSISYTPNFKQDLKRLDRQIAKRIIAKIEWLAEQSGQHGEPLHNMPGHLRGLQKYRVGDWRILFWVNENKMEIILYGVEHRNSVYKNLF